MLSGRTFIRQATSQVSMPALRRPENARVCLGCVDPPHTRPIYSKASMKPSPLVRELTSIVGPDAVLWRAEDLMLYEYDALSSLRAPDAVVFPTSAEHVIGIVRLAAKEKTPVIARGAGTGLSGGAVVTEGGIVVSFARMKKIVEIDIENERARVQPGVVNLDLSLAAADYGYYFVPDPSSQKACTIGGNVAENSGGPH